jgi:hypothetical protein
MRIGGMFSFNNGQAEIEERYPELLEEVYNAIQSIDVSVHKTKTSVEKTMPGKMLYNPKSLNKAFKSAFAVNTGWTPIRVKCDYPTEFYAPDYADGKKSTGAFREMDFVKNGLGVEVQFGKYAFMVYNVCAKMTIFNRLGFIKHGIEIVPMKFLAKEMSSGVSYFEQFVWDLQNRGIADIDIPVLIIGIY